MKNKVYFGFLLLVFTVLSVTMISNHELWRDEGHAWLIIQSAGSLPALFNAMRYDGTPALWHTILYPFAITGQPVIWMSIIHFVIIFCAVILFLLKSPFTNLQKTLFIFGYYIFYEYSAIARSYSLTVLLLFVTAVVFKDRFKKPLLYFGILSLLANANLHSLCIALTLTGFYVYELKKDKLALTPRVFSAFVLFAVVFLFCIYQLYPPADLTRSLSGWKGSNLSTTLNTLVSAFLPVQIPKLNFWNTKLVYYPDTVRSWLGIPLYLLSLLVFVRKPKALGVYLVSSFSLLLLFAAKYGGSARHHGLIFILFIFSLWISTCYKDRAIFSGKKLKTFFTARLAGALLTSLLVIQVIASPIPFYFDLKYDFSAGKKAADYLKAERLLGEDTFICVYDFFCAESILPYTDKAFYSIENERFERSIIFNTGCDKAYETPVSYKTGRINEVIKGKNYRQIIYISNSEITDTTFQKDYDLLKSLTGTIVNNESYYIYQKRRNE